MRIAQISKAFMPLAGSALLLVAASQQARADKFQNCVQSLWPAAKAGGVTRATFDLSLIHI